MSKKYFLLFLITIVSYNIALSQSIKLRVDMGSSINFSSHRAELFPELNYYQGPIITSEYNYKRMSNSSSNIGLSLEYDFKENNHFTMGFMFGEILSLNDKINYNFSDGTKDENGYRIVEPQTLNNFDAVSLNKIRISYSRDFGKRMIRFSPEIGISYAWVKGGTIPLDTIANSYNEFGKDYMFPSSDFTIKSYSMNTENINTFMASVGMNFIIYRKKREFLTIKLYYEQGFRPLLRRYTYVSRNSNLFIYNVLYAYGSAFYIKVSVPLSLYNFTDKKWWH